MNNDLKIIIAEDDDGHATLIEKNLKRAGVMNDIIRFADGEEVLDFFFKNGDGPHMDENYSYILLLDIRMPKIDGTEVLKVMKQDEKLKKLPVIVISTTDDPKEIELCHELGCNNYITKPVNYERFVDKIHQLGFFLKILKYPK